MYFLSCLLYNEAILVDILKNNKEGKGDFSAKFKTNNNT